MEILWRDGKLINDAHRANALIEHTGKNRSNLDATIKATISDDIVRVYPDDVIFTELT